GRTGTEVRKSEKPQVFTELPPDRADAAPKHADFLSNVTSRARDRVPGGDDALPRMNGEVDAPMVKLQAEGGASRPATPPTDPQHLETAPPRATPSPPPVKTQAGATGFTTDSKSTGFAANRTVKNGTPHDLAGAAGSSYIDQPEMENPDGNAGLTG